MPTTGLARRLVAAALACLLTTGCGLIGNDPAAEAVEDAAVAYQVAEATNAAAAVAALDAQAAARAAVDRFFAAVQTYYDSYGYGGSSAAAAAELQAAVASGEAATAEARRTTAVSGRAHIASWEAQVAWADAALDLETDGGTVLTVAGILLAELAALGREVTETLESRNAAALAIWDAETEMYTQTSDGLALMEAMDPLSPDLEAFGELLLEQDRARDAWTLATRRYEVADRAFRDAVVRYTAAQVAATEAQR